MPRLRYGNKVEFYSKEKDLMYEYIVRHGGRITDREMATELGLSKSTVQRRRVKLAGLGLISYKVSSRRGGTEYGAGQKVSKSGAKSGILNISNYNAKERETRVRAREGVGEDAVQAAWAKYRGRVLIEDEEAEMALWRERLGEERLIELIAAAWRRCTADRMSFGYFADYWVEPELSGAKKAGQKSGAKKVRKHEPAAATIKEPATAKTERRSGNEGTIEKITGGIRAIAWAKGEPAGNVGNKRSDDRAEPMPGVFGITVSKGGQTRTISLPCFGKGEDIHNGAAMPLLGDKGADGVECKKRDPAEICEPDVC